MRCQKSFVVNLEKITEYVKSEGGYIIIDGVHKIPVSVEKTQKLNNRLKEIMKIL
jgi:DNA-binding LytR/AlgR family response regulator